MHPLFIFLYCWAAVTDTATPGARRLIDMMVRLFFREYEATVLHDDDVLVDVTLLHSLLEPDTCSMSHLTDRFRVDVGASTWGPAAWELLHSLAASSNFTSVPTLLEIWEKVLPCTTCRHHLREHLILTRCLPTTQLDMFRYTVALHNAVNVSLNKPIVLFDVACEKFRVTR